MRSATRGQRDEKTRVVDASVRFMRQKRQRDALENDNFHEDPHANIVLQKNVPKFEEEDMPAVKRRKPSTPGAKTELGRRKKLESKLRFRRKFTALHEEYNQSKINDPEASIKGYQAYEEAAAPPSTVPPRKFCGVCGCFGGYTCIRCGTRFCSIECREVHNDTRCLKWTC
ncbi:unnamed protein product, partial [Mesorhabditis belari]|uniref:HIT-type domain-containing protein n=1 Tax=Mesorhabditis belari TaxID=2138241 RepID=A0AAF3EUN8_9BILA